MDTLNRTATDHCTAIQTLAVDGPAVTFGAARMVLGGLPSPLLAVPNVTAHPSTANVPFDVALCPSKG